MLFNLFNKITCVLEFLCVALFRNLGASYVFDVESVYDLTLRACGKEFVERYKQKSSSKPLPLLASACPGIAFFFTRVESMYMS